MYFSRITTGLAAVAVMALLFFAGGGLLYAQETEADKEARLRAELEVLEDRIDVQEVKLGSKRQERQSLERDVGILEAEIEKAQLEIQRNDIKINELSGGIQQKESHIETLNNEITRKQASLAELLRRKAALADMSLVELALSNESLSEFFSDLNVVQSVNESLQTRFAEIRGARVEAQEEQAALASQRDQVTDRRQATAAQKQSVEKKEAQKEQLAAVARGEERSYQDVLQAQQAEAARIRSELFALRDVQAIPFGTALQHAREVSAATGVRPAFLLAILQQESNLGQNVGTCNRPQDPPSKQWDQIMKPSRDIEPYKRIVAGLGVKPTTYPLSCSLSYGWGGAMGPAQFIPSTWEAYQNQIANALGVSVPNPWEPKHAFMASGIFLTDLGAGSGGYTAERRAALKYYSGGNWQSARVQFYGDDVMQGANDIQRDMIDPLDAIE
jgi:peptidoglycan hydrolase CwlO-like protein